jgi:sugar O-acyltransferase (sialic acid O-acetyltransferase NeuD family)
MDVVIVGAGGHGRVVLDILSAAGGHTVVGFLDADPGRRGSSVNGVPVLGPVNLLAKLRQQGVGHGIVAIGDNRARRRQGELLLEHGFELVTAVHPSAVVSGTAVLGRNVVVAAQAAVCADARVDDYAIVNTAAVVDHECHVGAAAHVTPGVRLAGRVRVGDEAFVGLGACVIQCLTVGRGATVGAGAVVLRDVPDGATVVGVPARVVKGTVAGGGTTGAGRSPVSP